MAKKIGSAHDSVLPEVQPDTMLTKSGMGNLRINGDVGGHAVLRISDMGDVVIKGTT